MGNSSIRLFSQLNASGQTMVLFAISVPIFLGIIILGLDVGQAYMHQRAAQVAADAAAYAGTRDLCLGKSHVDAAATATDYALTRNEATAATITINGKSMTVEASITYDTYLAGIFGYSTVTVPAIAAAKCTFASETTSLRLPIGWTCYTALAGSPSDDCEMDAITQDELNTRRSAGVSVFHGTYYSDVFVFDDYEVAGTPTAPDLCAPAGTRDCDLDEDGDNEVGSIYDRAWLNLNGGSFSWLEYFLWIIGGYGGNVPTHTWYQGEDDPGDSLLSPFVFLSAENLVGNIVLVPVINGICGGPPSDDPSCETNIHPAGPDSTVGSGAATYYHVGGFAQFYVSCVYYSGDSITCPGRQAAITEGSISTSEQTIEGYFILAANLDEVTYTDEDALDGGVFTIELTQ
jgi:Flp pilus assembly protein TadG